MTQKSLFSVNIASVINFVSHMSEIHTCAYCTGGDVTINTDEESSTVVGMNLNFPLALLKGWK